MKKVSRNDHYQQRCYIVQVSFCTYTYITFHFKYFLLSFLTNWIIYSTIFMIKNHFIINEGNNNKFSKWATEMMMKIMIMIIMIMINFVTYRTHFASLRSKITIKFLKHLSLLSFFQANIKTQLISIENGSISKSRTWTKYTIVVNSWTK